MDRRTFLGASALWLALPRIAAAEAEGVIEIRARAEALGLLENGTGSTESWLLGAAPGPAVIRVRQGERAVFRFSSELDRDCWLHFFGVRGPAEAMTVNVPAKGGGAVESVFAPPDAGTFWIGPVADISRTRDMGLYAMLIVEEAAPLGELADVPVILDDWKLREDGAQEEGFGDIEAMVGEGRLGNWFTVNNRFRPRLALPAGRYARLRVLNAANVRSMGLLFKGQDPLLVARDGQPVTPSLLDGKALVLAPGQRADLLVSATEGEVGIALDLFEDIVEIAYLVPEADGPAPLIAENFALPANPLPVPLDTGAARRIALRIDGGLKGKLATARFNGRPTELRELLENGKGWALNGVVGPAAEALFQLTEGETCVLDIDNRTGFAQPLYVHGHVWREVLPAGLGPARDTAVAGVGRNMQLALVAGSPGVWAIQSLLAERSDGGLIGAFVVEAAVAP